MEDKVEEVYNQRCAEVYDRWFGHSDRATVGVLAGSRLRERRGDWRRGAVAAKSERHLSVYERPARASGR